jgi:hypothetical protein
MVRRRRYTEERGRDRTGSQENLRSSAHAAQMLRRRPPAREVGRVDDVQFLYHLALRCASAPTEGLASDVELLVDSAAGSEVLRDSVTDVEGHLHAHPDDCRLRDAHELLVLAYRASIRSVDGRRVR